MASCSRSTCVELATAKTLEMFIGSREEKVLMNALRETENDKLINHVIDHCNGMKPLPFTKADIVFQGFLQYRQVWDLRLFTWNPEVDEPSSEIRKSICFAYHHVFHKWLFSDVAEKGVKAVPEGYEDIFLCLFNFINTNKVDFHERAISNCQKMRNDETSLVAVLAEHIFSQLTPDHSYFIDENVSKKPNLCPCGLDDCKKKVVFGNTTIGSSKVWHGCPDIFIDQKVPVTFVKEMEDDSVVDVEDDSDSETNFDVPFAKKRKKDSEEAQSSSDGICIEIKKKKSHDILFHMNVIDQIMAEAITNAFAQVNANGSLKGLLIPSFGCSQDYIMVVLYDPENDFLLQTDLIKLFDATEHIAVLGLVQVWMFLNFAGLLKHNITAEFDFEKSKFHDSVKGCLHYYKTASYKKNLGSNELNYMADTVLPRMFKTSQWAKKKYIE